MQHHSLPVSSETVFAALATRPACIQAKDILDRFGRKTEFLSGPMPFVPEGGVVLLGIDLRRSFLSPPSKYLRVLPRQVKEGRSLDAYLARIAGDMSLLRDSFRVVFINEARASASSGLFEGDNLAGFEAALGHLCGYQPPKPARPPRDWKAEQLARRARSSHYYDGLWAVE